MKKNLLAAATAALPLLFACGKEEAKPQPPANALHIAQSEDLSKKALEVLNRKCTACHTAERFSARDFSSEEWSAVIDKMVGKGVQLSGDELDVLRHWRKGK